MADAPDTTETKRDYRPTVFLPKTDFPMKAGLPQKEPVIAARWKAEDLYGQVRKARAGREKFIFHDGPPYANGDIHIGHTLNKTLKDMVVRTQTLLGKDAPYVPGWDCHGLPIEWKIEEQYRKKKLNKDEVPPKEFRAECRAYAQHWVDVQREQFQRLGITGDWDNPYLTMDFQAEATIVSELFKFAESGQVYRGAKPVMWSPVEKTALAEAEIEYEDIVSTQIDVAFEIVESPIPELVGAHAVVWTTTPWTIPVNQGIAYNPDVEYGLYEISLGVSDDGKGNLELEQRCNPFMQTLHGTKIVIAKQLTKQLRDRLDRFLSDKATQTTVELNSHLIERVSFNGSDLAGTIARHPMHKLGGFFAKPRPFLPGDFVTTDQGTGLVHMAPDHGEDDFELCKANGIDPVFAVEADGKYRPDWLWLGGQGSVINNKFNAPDGPICSDLREAGALLAASADFRHSYPHSWRSKAKVIYRCTPQWFVAMDRPLPQFSPLTRAELRWENEGGEVNEVCDDRNPSLRELALNAIAQTRFVPEKGRNRIGSMVEGRPDWVLSRQRAWGVPIALFVERKTGQLLVDHEVNAADRRRRPRAGRGRLGPGERRRLPRQPQPRRLRDGHRHLGRLVRQRLHPRVHAGERPLARPELARRPLSRRLRPASRLVPVVLARKLRNARPGAVQRGPHPWLHDGRQGHEDVEEPRQHHQPARPDEGAWRRHSCGCGRCRSTSPRTTGSARKSSAGSRTSTASCAIPSATCSERSPISARRRRSAPGRCRNWSCTCSI